MEPPSFFQQNNELTIVMNGEDHNKSAYCMRRPTYRPLYTFTFKQMDLMRKRCERLTLRKSNFES